MSDENKIPCSGTPQTMIEAQAAERLIGRLHDLDWEAGKQAELDAWLAESVAHEVAYLRLEAGWNGADRLAVLRGPLRQAALSGRAKQSGNTKFHVATILILCGLLGTAGYIATTPTREQVFATPIGGRERITLADGSEIELNTDTELRLPPGSRRATLVKGEAYFQIQHNASHPFVLNVGNHRIVDLSTQFVVRQKDTRFEIAVVEGRARIESLTGAASAQSAILSPGDVAIATQNRLAVTKKHASFIEDELSWRSGFVVFHHTTLSEAADELNRYNTKKIVIADEKTARRFFGGKFRANDVESFASVVGTALDLSVDRRGNEILISGK